MIARIGSFTTRLGSITLGGTRVYISGFHHSKDWTLIAYFSTLITCTLNTIAHGLNSVNVNVNVNVNVSIYVAHHQTDLPLTR